MFVIWTKNKGKKTKGDYSKTVKPNHFLKPNWNLNEIENAVQLDLKKFEDN